MRISPKLIRQAHQIDKALPPLLLPTRSLASAINELRWIRQELPKHKWNEAIRRRSAFEPLQYILGTQPFGDVDIICRPGVLIPRWETEEWVTRLASVLGETTPKEPLKILDVCTGSGCIPILLHRLLTQRGIGCDISGFDVSPTAIELAKENASKHSTPVLFYQQDLFSVTEIPAYDIIVSNPPYVPLHHEHDLEKSVKYYEPKLALLGDLEFFQHLVRNVVLPSNAHSFVFELCHQGQVDAVKSLLPDWHVGSMFDSQGKLRCVVGSKKDDLMTLCIDK